MALTGYFPSLTAGAANTKGSYTEIVASTPYASSRVHLQVLSTVGSRRFLLVDLATGAAAAETVVVANVAVDCDADSTCATAVAIDVDLPAGTRLAARCQSVTAATVCFVRVYLEDRALGSLANPVTYGTDTGNSRGTIITVGAVANTKTAYVQFAASTSVRFDALAICGTITAQGATLTAATSWSLDVALGAASAEVIVVADLAFQGGLNADTARPGIVRLPVSIPAGSRLALRLASNSTISGDRSLCLSVIGMQEPASAGGSAAGAVAYVG